MTNKKSFTLIEIIISIILFSIILIFLYKVLDMTRKTNDFFNKKVVQIQQKDKIRNILLRDILNGYEISSDDKNTTLELNRHSNSIFRFKTANTYYDSFYTNVTYLVSRKDNLLRIESKTRLKNNGGTEDFVEESYARIVDENISRFEINQYEKDKFAVYIRYKNDEEVFYIFQQLR